MVNEERIKLMTRMAAYEKEGHKKNKIIVSFFRSDYISMQMLKSVIATTIAFGIMFGLYILYISTFLYGFIEMKFESAMALEQCYSF